MPPLSALRAFSAFAETGGVVEAGARIGVTHAAISQQIRALEAHLDLALVDRSARALALTAEGRRLAQALADGFGTIDRALADLTDAQSGRPLQITTTAAFASGWLMPRLASFRASHPGIDLMVDASSTLRPFGPDGVDVALRYGSGQWPGVDAQLLVESSVVVVAAPSVVSGRPITRVEDLAGLPWLQELGTSETTRFLDAHGVARAAGNGMVSLPGNLVADAARDGQGVAVIARSFIEADIAAGRLVVLFEDSERKGYFIVTRPGVMRPPVKAFVRWALRQAAAGNGAAA